MEVMYFIIPSSVSLTSLQKFKW